MALAMLSAVAATTAAAIAYTSTSGRLASEVDDSLTQAAARVVSATSAMGPGTAMMGQGGGIPMASQMMGGQGPLGALGLVAVQYVRPDGNLARVQGQVLLPVLGRDRQIARYGGAAWLRTEGVGKSEYRVLTEPLPGGGAVQLGRDTSEDAALLGSLRLRLGLLDVAIVLVAAAVGWLFARHLVRPLRHLALAAERVASTGRLDVQVEVGSADETGRLSRAFSVMLGSLAQLRAQQRHLAEDAGHELRTPLTSLRTNVDILRRHKTLPAETRARVLGALDSELRELTGLVNELVELNAERHQEEAVEVVRLDEVAEEVVERARRRSGRHITLTAQPCAVTAQPRALARAVSNLVDNAIKFSPPSSPVEVSVRSGRTEVRDHGTGLGPEDVPRVFDRFYRSAGARGKPGSGLGLAIVSQVAEDNGGRAFAGNHPDGGAVIGFELPCVPRVGASD